MSCRTSLKLTDEHERQLEKGNEIVASGPVDDPPMSVVIDATLAHLVESEENIQDAPDEPDLVAIQELRNTSVIGVEYRMRLKNRLK